VLQYVLSAKFRKYLYIQERKIARQARMKKKCSVIFLIYLQMCAFPDLFQVFKIRTKVK